MTTVTLYPDTQFSGSKRPTTRELDEIHHQSHEQCFIANSVKTLVTVNLSNSEP